MNMRAFDATPQAGLAFLMSQITHVEQKVWERKYPDITYQNFVPVDNSANPWAPTVTYFSTDKVGTAKWVAGTANDFPLAEVESSKFETSVYMAGTGYKYGLEEINQARMLGRNLTDEKAAAARRAYEEMCERVAFFGDTAKGFKGLTNYTGIAIIAAALNAGATSALWLNKTPQEILKDINDAVSGVYIGSNTVEMADTVILPLASFSDISVRMVSNLSTMTVLEYIKKNNMYTALTGRELTIRAMRQLDTAGGSGSKRMVVYSKDDQVLKMHIPLPLQFLAPQQEMLEFIVPGYFRLGGLDVRRTGGLRYVDGI